MDSERQFRLIWISQSDGKPEWRNPKTSKVEPNAPPKTKVLNSNKGEMAYEELDFNDRRHKDWRKKLGTLLIQEEIEKKKASGQDVGDLGILGALPENYKLYEGTRHEGTKLRKEVFVYGHPEGPKKRYRAAREFIPHLIWLTIDENMDPRNCECKFCAPPDAQKAFEEMTQYQVKKFGIKVADEKPTKQAPQAAKATAPQASAAPRKSSMNANNPPAATNQTSQPLIPSSTPSTQFAQQQSQTIPQPQPQPQRQPPPQRQNSNTSVIAQQPMLAPNQKPTPPVPHVNPDQKLDSLPQKFMFRQGETIWFARDNGQGPFGLGVVISREMARNPQGVEEPRYVVQPLSHPFFHPGAEHIYKEIWLKPWLAFSPPDPFHETLRNVDTSFNKLPWKEILEGKWGPGDVEADGSIFAARTVDGTYTTFEPLYIRDMEKSYNGVFFGGEKIWRGDAVRLAGQSREGQTLIISDILEVTPAPGQPTELIFVGDVYIWKRLKPDDKSPPPNNFLPQLVNLDLNFRNEAARKAQKPIHVWHFLESRARFSWEDLKGRWYPSRYLIPSLCGEQEFQQQIAVGEIVDAGTKINSQGDYAPSENGSKVIMKRDTRTAAFGSSIPPGKTDFGISNKQYTSLIGNTASAANPNPGISNAQSGANPRQNYTAQQQAQAKAQALQQQFQQLTPQQRQQIEQQQYQQRLIMQRAAQQQQQQRTSMAQDVDTSMPDAGTMDVDFNQFIN